MAWTADIPTLPEATGRLPEDLRLRAEAAWNAVHTLLNAISAWENWLNLARVTYLENSEYDIAAGDAISRVGATAIRTLCGLDLRIDIFSGDGGHLLQHWPEAPSDCVDATWYVHKVDRRVDQEIKNELFHSRYMLLPALEELRDQIETAPVSVFKTIVGSKRIADSKVESLPIRLDAIPLTDAGQIESEWQRIKEMTETLLLDIPEALVSAAIADAKSPRRALIRDHLFLKWNDEGETPAKIRDKWNGLPEAERRHICPSCWKTIEGKAGREVVKQSLLKAKKERKTETIPGIPGAIPG